MARWTLPLRDCNFQSLSLARLNSVLPDSLASSGGNIAANQSMSDLGAHLLIG